MGHVEELHSSYSLVSSRHACSEFCSKCLNSIFTSLSSQSGLPGVCAGCWHCEAVPRCELLPRRARCGVEECFKHTLSNPFLFCSLDGVCSLQQSNPLISIPRIRARGADSSKLGKARLVTWALPEKKECFIRSVYKAYLNDFFSEMSNCWLTAICLVKICFPIVPVRPSGTVTLARLWLLQARGWSSVPSAAFTASCHESSQ